MNVNKAKLDLFITLQRRHSILWDSNPGPPDWKVNALLVELKHNYTLIPLDINSPEDVTLAFQWRGFWCNRGSLHESTPLVAALDEQFHNLGWFVCSTSLRPTVTYS